MLQAKGRYMYSTAPTRGRVESSPVHLGTASSTPGGGGSSPSSLCNQLDCNACTTASTNTSLTVFPPLPVGHPAHAWQVLGPQPGPVPPPGRSPTDDVSSLPPSERPLFPPTDMPSDPDLTAAIQSAGSWQQLRELYVANARRMDPAQLYATIARSVRLYSSTAHRALRP